MPVTTKLLDAIGGDAFNFYYNAARELRASGSSRHSTYRPHTESDEQRKVNKRANNRKKNKAAKKARRKNRK